MIQGQGLTLGTVKGVGEPETPIKGLALLLGPRMKNANDYQ